MASRDSIICFLCIAVTTLGAPSDRLGKFKINDGGVNGEGTYLVRDNGTTVLGFQLMIDGPSRTSPTFKPISGPGPSKDSGQQKQQEQGALTEEQKATGSDDKVPAQKAPDNKLTEKEPAANLATQGSPPGDEVKQQQQQQQKQARNDKTEQLQAANAAHLLSDEELTFVKDGLAEHNKYRAIHNAPTMILDEALSAEAQKFAKELAHLETLKHSDRPSRPGEGENLAMGCSTEGTIMSAAAAVKKWYDEVCKYDFNNKTFQRPAGHFTQMMWKSTDRLGMGRAYGNKFGLNCTYVVARYSPIGNIADRTASNVEKGTFDQTYCNTVTRAVLAKSEPQRDEEREGRVGEDEKGYLEDYNGDQYGDNESEGYMGDEPGRGGTGYREKIPRREINVL
ncbi:probable pathogenesis-related protein CaO19.6200 isoform X2 [Nematostella vectensis]|uniref:probable pathogenesis-related protein CaO19.6200 isoform X2 n=1 Tax=Nematostella vectensis TaxID=45351 RepID=UPI002076F3BF|nr:probable pathogenesis-related protein CaO19.6200 isoform X2 [Nematostella vectensis]